MEQGAFREDLFFRLNVVPIVAPPLRGRRDDVPTLANHFLRLYAEENDFLPKQLSPDALKDLCAYDWPGNIRELKNLVERLSIMVATDTIEAEDLPGLNGPHAVKAESGAAPGTLPGLAEGKTLREIREAVEQLYISHALKNNNWNVTQAARILGIERTNLHKKIKYYAIER